MATAIISPTRISTAGRRPPTTSLALISMPWAPLDSPYLAVITLAACAHAAAPNREIYQEHLYLDWYRLLQDAYGPKTSRDLYSTVAEEGAYSGAGDFIFGRLTFPESDERVEAFVALCDGARLSMPPLRPLRELATAFVSDVASRLAELLPRGCLVGLSSTFTQTVPSIALGRELKAARPDLHWTLGGANLNVEKADVLLDRFPELDSVVVGEGEETLVRMLADLDQDGCVGDGSGTVLRQPRASRSATHVRAPFVALDANPAPAMSPYFDRLRSTGLDSQIEPRLGFELARGCWWGEKHHCTFCGLNGEGMKFRRKTRGTIPDDILGLVREHKVLDVIFADNILHPSDIAGVFGQLPSGLDMRMHLEVKANLKRVEIARLREHGVWHLQPGIESLATRPLELMRKGVKPWQNVRFLRDVEELGVTCSWNILTGFPEETHEDYEDMLARISHLHHLQPPGSVAVLGLVRYSPLFTDPALGVGRKRPTPDAQHVYAGLEPREVSALADVYEADDDVCAVGRQVAEELEPLIDEWRRRHRETFLLELATAGEVLVERVGASRGTLLQLTDSHLVALWNNLRGGRTRVGLRREFEALDGPRRRDCEDLLATLEDRSLVFADEDAFVTLPTRYEDHIPYRIT